MQIKNIFKKIIKFFITEEIKQEIWEEKQKLIKPIQQPVFNSQMKRLTREERIVLETKLEELLYSLHFIFNSKHTLRNNFNPAEVIEIDKTDGLITVSIPNPYIVVKNITIEDD